MQTTLHGNLEEVGKGKGERALYVDGMVNQVLGRSADTVRLNYDVRRTRNNHITNVNGKDPIAVACRRREMGRIKIDNL